jgi:hypothetical protein
MLLPFAQLFINTRSPLKVWMCVSISLAVINFLPMVQIQNKSKTWCPNFFVFPTVQPKAFSSKFLFFNSHRIQETCYFNSRIFPIPTIFLSCVPKGALVFWSDSQQMIRPV